MIGVHPAERRVEQRVVADLDLELDTRPAARSGRIALTADYDVVARQAEALLRFRRFVLVETACDELAAVVIAAHRSVSSVIVTLHKPSALPGRARAASVVTSRSRAELEAGGEALAPGGRLEVLRTAGVLIERVALGRGVETVIGAAGRRRLLLISEGRVWHEGAELRPGDSLTVERAARLEPVADLAELLCVTEPSGG